MKKYLIAMLLGLVLVLALATTIALADNGPHGGFTANTDACAGCHRLHSAQVGSNELLIADSAEKTCMSCHDGTGAGTNVKDGVYLTSGKDASGFANAEGGDGKSLLAGGFTYALMATDWSGKYAFDASKNAISGATTSRHLNLVTPVTGTIWGSGAENTSNGEMELECTSCHDPHGNAGWDTSQTPDVRVPSYRLLRWQPSGSNGFTAPAAASTSNWTGGALPTNDSDLATGWLVPDNQLTSNTEWYTIGTQIFNGTGPFADGDYSSGNGAGVYRPSNGSATVDYIPAAINLPFFCAQCHDRYFNNSRLRNDTDASVYCGAPYAGMTLSVKDASQNSVTVALTPYTDADAPYIHPINATRCVPVLNSDGTLASWGDNGKSGDDVYTYRHASGDVRYSADGANSQGTDLVGGTTALGATLKVNTGKTVTSISRSCVACHVAHGTTALANPPGGVDAGAVGVGSLAGGSVLLRMDGRSICLRCHAPNFTIATSASPYSSGLSLTVAVGTAMGGTSFSISNSGTAFSTSSNPGVSGVRFIYTNGAGVLTTSNLSLIASGTLKSGQCIVTTGSNINCKTPEGFGSASVYVLSTGSVQSALVGTFVFNAVTAPGSLSLSAITGSMAGGETVTITGSNFTSGTAWGVSSVYFGFRQYSVLSAGPLTNGTCTVDSATQITCQTAATYAGSINVKVTTTGGQFVTTPFTFGP